MSEERGITVLGICGSLRVGSYNKATLQTAIEMKPPGMTIETADIGSIPLYNEDVRALGFPPPVERFRAQIAAADALLFVTPVQLLDVRGLEETPSTGPRARPISPLRGSQSRSWGPPPEWPAPRGRNTICAAAASFSICIH